jgi:hypothetical protein
MADLADRHRLYQLSVQNPRTEVDFVDRTYRHCAGGAPVRCGRISAERRPSVASGSAGASAIGPGASTWTRCIWNGDGATMSAPWTRTERGECRAARGRCPWRSRRRTRHRAGDELQLLAAPRPQVIFALLRARPRRLAPDGIFFLDAFGGYDTFRLLTEERRIQDPDGGALHLCGSRRSTSRSPVDLSVISISGSDDGSEWNRAFSYDWRLWTLPEIRELLRKPVSGG